MQIDAKEEKKRFVQDELEKLAFEVNNLISDNHLIKLEDYLSKNIIEMIQFVKMKIIIQSKLLFSQT